MQTLLVLLRKIESEHIACSQVSPRGEFPCGNLCAGHNYIGTEHILLGLLREGEGVAARCLDTLGADAAKIRTQVIRMVGESQEAVAAGPAGGSGSNKTPTLEEYGTNLTAQAESVSSWLRGEVQLGANSR